MLAGLERPDRHLTVKPPLGEDRDRIHVRREHLLERLIGDRDALLRRHLGRPFRQYVGQPHVGHVRVRGPQPQERGGELAGADHTDADSHADRQSHIYVLRKNIFRRWNVWPTPRPRTPGALPAPDPYAGPRTVQTWCTKSIKPRGARVAGRRHGSRAESRSARPRGGRGSRRRGRGARGRGSRRRGRGARGRGSRGAVGARGRGRDSRRTLCTRSVRRTPHRADLVHKVDQAPGRAGCGAAARGAGGVASAGVGGGRSPGGDRDSRRTLCTRSVRRTPHHADLVHKVDQPRAGATGRGSRIAGRGQGAEVAGRGSGGRRSRGGAGRGRRSRLPGALCAPDPYAGHRTVQIWCTKPIRPQGARGLRGGGTGRRRSRGAGGAAAGSRLPTHFVHQIRTPDTAPRGSGAQSRPGPGEGSRIAGRGRGPGAAGSQRTLCTRSVRRTPHHADLVHKVDQAPGRPAPRAVITRTCPRRAA